MKRIELKCFAATFEDETVSAARQRTVHRSPLVATLTKSTELQFKFVERLN